MARKRKNPDPEHDRADPQPEGLGQPPPFAWKGALRGASAEVTPEVVEKISQALARGCTRGDAAILAGITPGTLEGWLRRGAAEVEAENWAHHLVAVSSAVQAAEAHYRDWLISEGNRASSDRNVGVAFLKWRLQLSSPKDFQQREVADSGLFEHLSPQDAQSSLELKIARFLEAEGLRAEPPAGAVALAPSVTEPTREEAHSGPTQPVAGT